MSPRKNNSYNKNTMAEVIVEQARMQNQGNLSHRLEDNETFEDTVIKVEVYESEREITRVLQDYVHDTEEERRLVRKIDMKLLPILGVMYALQCVDRTGMVSFKENLLISSLEYRSLHLGSMARRSWQELGNTTNRVPLTALWSGYSSQHMS
jgi:hypothetical protein